MSDDDTGKLQKLAALSAVRDARCYSKAEKLVLVMLLSHARASDGLCYPSFELLAEETGMSRSVVAAAVASLQSADGPVRLTRSHRARRDGTGGRSSNLYRMELRPAGRPKVAHVESSRRTQLAGGLSPEMEGVESENPGVESSRRTGSSTGKLAREARQFLAPGEPARASAPAVGFALEAPSKSPKPKPAKTSQPDPNVNVLRDWHRAEHQRLRGVEPTYTGNQHAAAGKAWKDLLSVRSVEQAQAIITAALVDGFNVDPWAILKAQNKLATSGAAPRNGRSRYQPQAVTPALAELGRASGARLQQATANAEPMAVVGGAR